MIYIIIWLIVFIVPILGIKEDGIINWEQVRHYWMDVLPFFILFLINNYLLVPYFLLRKRSFLYLLFAIITVFCISTARLIVFPHEQFGPPRSSIQAKPPHRPRHPGNKPGMRFPIRMFPILNDWIAAIFIVGLNISVRFLFKSIRDERQIKELEKHTLQAELNYLKAQINPHFFMNTLNNIHALVDIDTEKAKETVIELSKIMRYVLYDADQAQVTLHKELTFLDNYINLMRIRFTDEVEVKISYPEVIPEVKVPPLLLITFVENAFKHGVSYQHNSFIHLKLTIENNQIHFTVSNSIVANSPSSPGVGMENLRKRLSLLYGENYTLKVVHGIETYEITLIIPV
ncbi:histidine kinase [Bacteroides sp. 224]|nr:histidine kinase [Bacteroides sp. 224]